MYVYLNTCILIYIHIYIYIYLHMYMQIYVHVQIYAYIYTHVHIYINIYALPMCCILRILPVSENPLHCLSLSFFFLLFCAASADHG